MRRAGFAQRVARERGFCRRCVATRDLVGHHTIAIADGGPDTAENIDALCRHCHSEWHRVESNWDYEDFIRSVPGDYLARLPVLIEGRAVTLAEAEHAWLVFTLGRYIAFLIGHDPVALARIAEHAPSLFWLGLSAATVNPAA